MDHPDQGKKTMRHFLCLDVLWDRFEQMATEYDCSIDYLINESMRYYARSKNVVPAGPRPGPVGQPPSARQGGGVQQGYRPQPPGPPPGGPGGRPPMPGQGPTLGYPNQQGQRPAAPPPPMAPQPPQRPGAFPGGPPQQPGMPPGPPPQVRPPQPPMQPPRQPGMPPQQQCYPPQNSPARPAPGPAMSPAGGPTLYLIFNNQRISIEKDQFIVGRGSKTSDLAIKDGNISRKHAAVIRRNGTFYIKDLGSTNGIDYKGMRIDNKRIDEGDVFHLCDYELRFTYRG